MAEDKYPTILPCEYRTDICPNCGGYAKFPYTGNVTSEQMEEDFNSCIKMHVVDEGGGTTGYVVVCHKESK